MTKYQEFLNGARIIPEDLFNDIINSLPNVEISHLNFEDLYDLQSQDTISEFIISDILYKWNFAYAENANFENKTFELNDVEFLEDLEEIKNTFSKWTISNYDELKEAIIEDNEEHEINDRIDKLVQEVRSKCFDNTGYISELEKFVNNL